jgi:GntR family transcriptional regulator
MTINRSSPLPLYLQLAQMIREKIEQGEYACGERIPSEPELVKELSLGRPTVRQAIGLLVQEGDLERRKGSGTYVREKPADIDLFSLAGTSSAFGEKGIPLTQRLLKKISLVTTPSLPHHPFSDKEVYFFSRLSLSDAEPVLLEETWLDPVLFSGIEKYDFSRISLSRIVREKFFLTPLSCRQTFRAGTNRVLGPLLKAGRNEPLLLAARTLNFPEHPDGIYSLLSCRTNRYTFSQILTGRF